MKAKHSKVFAAEPDTPQVVHLIESDITLASLAYESTAVISHAHLRAVRRVHDITHSEVIEELSPRPHNSMHRAVELLRETSTSAER